MRTAIEPQANLNGSVTLFLDSAVHMDGLNILALFRVPHNNQIRKWAKASYFWVRPFLCRSRFLIDFHSYCMFEGITASHQVGIHLNDLICFSNSIEVRHAYYRRYPFVNRT